MDEAKGEVRYFLRLADRSFTAAAAEEAYREIARIIGIEDVTLDAIDRFLEGGE